MFDATIDAPLCGGIVVALPVRDEVALIGPCLQALQAQTRPADFILLLLNNCRDDTSSAIGAICGGQSRRLIVETELPDAFACAGEARRLALNLAAGLAPAGVILTTDADTIVPRDWIAANLAHLEAGLEMVCGQARIMPEDLAALPPHLRAYLRNEARYLQQLDAIAARLDPDAFDPWPRHQQHSGASLAMRTDSYRRAGGAPFVRSGEDRALVAAFQRVDARIRHAPEIEVAVSGRLHGRAVGGMAECLRTQLDASHGFADPRLEPAAAHLRRVLARRAARRAWVKGSNVAGLARRLALPEAEIQLALRQTFFGAAWARLEAASPALPRARLAVAALPGEMQRADRLLRRLRAVQPARETEDA